MSKEETKKTPKEIQREIELKNASVRIESLMTLIESTDIPNEETKQKNILLFELNEWKEQLKEKTIQIDKFNQWMTNTECWFHYFQPVSLYSVFISQFIWYILL